MPSHQAALTEADLDAIVAHVYRLAMNGPIVVNRHSPLQTAMVDAGLTPELVPRAAPDLQVVDAAGRSHSLAEERGRVVLLNFWGSTCEHCLAGMPKLQALAERWESQGLTVLSVCADAENALEAQQLVSGVSPHTQVWIDETGLANSQFEVQVLPTIWFIDRAGRLIAGARGMKDWDSSAMETLIGVLVSEEATDEHS